MRISDWSSDVCSSDLGKPSMYVKDILRQAWPVLVSSWASLIFGVLDTAMAGHASAADLQAMALAASIYITVFVGLMGVVHALIPIIAQHYGGDRKSTRLNSSH